MALQEKLDKKRFVVTIEIQPTIDEEIYRLLQDLDCLKGRVDCLNVPELKKTSTDIDPLATGKALIDRKFDTIYQTTTRGKHRPNLETDLLKASQIGIQNILVFSEDYTLTGESKNEKMFFHVDSAKLFTVLESLRQGRDIKGQDLETPVSFMLGSGVDAGKGKKTTDRELREIDQMVEGGARFFQTSPVFDLDGFSQFMKLVEPMGVSILAGVMLLRTGEMARFVQKQLGVDVPDWIIDKMTRSPDKLKASIEIFAELVAGLRDLCQGIHIIPLGWYAKLPMFFDAARL